MIYVRGSVDLGCSCAYVVCDTGHPGGRMIATAYVCDVHSAGVTGDDRRDIRPGSALARIIAEHAALHDVDAP